MIEIQDLQTDKVPADKRAFSAPPKISVPAGKRDGSRSRSALQDLYFLTVCPGVYQRTRQRIDALLRKQGMRIEEIIEATGGMLEEQDIYILNIHGRTKGVYSTHLKLPKYDNDMTRIHDLIAVRIIVDDIDTCYRALQIIHASCLPVAGRVKDYIATPKPNGYQSLHSTVKGIGTGMFEVQIRTAEMHAQAEIGSAAHWVYDLAKSSQRIMDSISEQQSSPGVYDSSSI